MTLTEAALADLLASEGATIPSRQIERVLVYFDLLRRWNRRLNLVGFDLDGRWEPETIRRVLVEPILGSVRAGRPADTHLDLGSGGGSPAIPFALAAGLDRNVHLVESRSRKVAFLREALRACQIGGQVHNCRLEELQAPLGNHQAASLVVTVRAVRPDRRFWTEVERLVGGLQSTVMWFHGPTQTAPQDSSTFEFLPPAAVGPAAFVTVATLAAERRPRI